MAEPFLGEIRLFPYNFAPRGWAFCNGQLLSISQNIALFSLLGTTYGGNGQTTFGLPDLRGRFAMSSGQGPGLSVRDLGEIDGTETVALTAAQMPAHTHALNGSTATATTTVPTGNLHAAPARPQYVAPGTTTPLAAQSVGSAGSSQAHENMPPYLVLNYCISLEGIYPSRS